MRTFDHVDNKLFESDFFLKEIENSGSKLFELRCFFSAFVSSSRSVTFALQASMNGVVGFEAWYAIIQNELRQNELARFFHECRTDDQKLGFNHITRGTSNSGKMKWFFGEPEKGRYKFIPKIDVVEACRCQMGKVCSIVDRAYLEFGIEIDPDQRYRPESLASQGISLEDIEEFLGCPRGWTDTGDDTENKDLHRLSILTKEIPRSAVKPLLAQYLNRDLEYPTDRFRFP
jgi:hypothetical protein